MRQQLTDQQIEGLQHILQDLRHGSDTVNGLRVGTLWELANLGLITLDPITLTENGVIWLFQNGYLTSAT